MTMDDLAKKMQAEAESQGESCGTSMTSAE